MLTCNPDGMSAVHMRHDCWHFLSAIALALFAMLLLDIRVHSWARKSGIQILFEQQLDCWGSDSDSDLHSSSDDEAAGILCGGEVESQSGSDLEDPTPADSRMHSL